MKKPYLSFGEYIQNQFGCKVYKLPVDAGFTCPNIDGTLAYGGCVYCNNDTFRPHYVNRKDSLETQIEEGKKVYHRKNAERFLVYFQSYTNTYAPIEQLRDLYTRALRTEEVVGLCIGTRPDCVSGAVIDLLNEFAEKGYEIWLELGLQSSNDETLERINRMHDFDSYKQAVNLIPDGSNLNICTHIMFGLPGETVFDMKKTVSDTLRLGFNGIKLHQTQVVNWTELAEEYWNKRYDPIEYETYRDLVIWSLQRIPNDTVVHRIFGETTGESLIAPRWNVSKQEFDQEVNEKLARSKI